MLISSRYSDQILSLWSSYDDVTLIAVHCQSLSFRQMLQFKIHYSERVNANRCHAIKMHIYVFVQLETFVKIGWIVDFQKVLF